MLRYALAAIGAALVIAAAIVFLRPPPSGPRPEPRILASGDPAAPPGGFVVHDAPPATPPAPPATPQGNQQATPQTAPAAPGGDLDAAIQRLRAARPSDPPAADAGDPAAPPPAVPPSLPAPGQAASVPPPDVPAAPRWTSVTGQGTRWRMVRAGTGYTVSIDLGGGQTAEIHVQPAFANLDPQAINVRIDYLRDTIVQNFSRQSSSYTFARDGSVSLDH